MSEEFVVCHCSPTLAGLKTGALFPCPGESWKSVADFCRKLNRQMSGKDLFCLPLQKENGQTLLYLCRPGMLWKDLSQPAAKEILQGMDYPVENPHKCLSHLCRVLKGRAEFPHEIGLFLGYPPEDVDGFIRYQGRGAKCVGTWKVYGDEAAAKRRFAAYKSCARAYRKQYEKVNSIDRLVVSCSDNIMKRK